MPYVAYRRVPVAQGFQPKMKVRTLAAPTRGLVTAKNYAEGDPRECRILDNGFPEHDGIRFRRGTLQKATIGNDAVTALFSFNQGGTEKLFAASDSDIYDVSALNQSTPPSAAVSSQTDGYYSTAQFATAGGEFLYACNEADAPQLYNSSTWTQITGVSSPAITGVTTTLLRAVWAYRSRLYFIERDSLNAWVLPAASIGGAAVQVSLQGVFREGGTLLFGATWSLDTGEGQDDKNVFVTDTGEIAVYEGSNPGDATDWNLVGVYKTSTPLGKNAFTHLGGDLLIGTVDGIVPLTQIINRDADQTTLFATTRDIEPDWKRATARRVSTYPWEIHRWPEKNMMVVALPHTTAQALGATYVMNTETGGWARWTGLDVQCLAVFGGTLYFGDASGEVHAMETGGEDNGKPYTVRIGYAFQHLKAPNRYKDISTMRATFLATDQFGIRQDVATDYVYTYGAAPNALATQSGSALWDTAVWDTDTWDDGLADFTNATLRTTRWEAVAGAGIVHAPVLQITLGNTNAVDARLVSVDLSYSEGGDQV